MADQTFFLPDLGEGLTEAEIVRWLVAEGDVVSVDQSIVEVETAKSLVEVPSPYAGLVATLHAAEGSTLDVGKPLITVAEFVPEREPAAVSSASIAAVAYREEEGGGSGNVLIGYGTSGGPSRARSRRSRTPTLSPVSERREQAARGSRLVISPLVRNFARVNGLDLESVTPTGRGGVITRADVERQLAAPIVRSTVPPGAENAAERRIPLNGFRKAVSAALSRSRSEIPEATVWVDVDATRLWELRESSRLPGDPGPGILAHLARFVVAALKEYPVLNARLDVDRQEIVELEGINLAIAVQGERGLVVPAVIGAGTMTTSELDSEIRRLTATAREGRATAAELSSGTFTLNNYGGFRVDGSAAIINHPQVAILGFGRIIDRAWVVDGEISVRKITQMSFVFDHRVCDGGTAAGFMRSVADAIENPIAAMARL
ncbi:pyruvate dehydrogenase E2 component (dihydrolipoamide acetyltransferase) [Nocardioides ginsengisegetis]|uniref:Dihydrolipoamide acetyltransferase component of pyruvate dehydrogenase complex n=1 Tax=Nocardioides ginsengisegetis TaxID=661491 RepID=A0A7W3P9B3_9ACTN|nr:dihydrolipoamide acetyltransferase family protein [Nocardioides ginsengisegetis]MBA8803247.1 pyruvate dehydrogenase E2 component (dihydrolipoamide acetyltransferase) [Nocardioides ginsengisegetis]